MAVPLRSILCASLRQKRSDNPNPKHYETTRERKAGQISFERKRWCSAGKLVDQPCCFGRGKKTVFRAVGSLKVPSGVAAVVQLAHRVPSAGGHRGAGHHRRAHRGALELALLPAALPQERPDGDDGELAEQEDGRGHDESCCDGGEEKGLN